MVTDKDFEKFVDRIYKFVRELRINNTLEVQGRIDQFYYMQKISELEILKEHIDESQKRTKFLQENLESQCRELFTRWSKDARWLNLHVNQRTDVNQCQQ